jgi:RNA polymerase sigma factor (sigma-70 family)
VDGERDWGRAEQFDELWGYLRAGAFRMLGTADDVDDALHECWQRLMSKHPSTIEDLRGWLTVMTARSCLDLLRQRNSRREQTPGARPPETTISDDSGGHEGCTFIADSIWLALAGALETLTPPERLAFVLRDVFGVPEHEIAEIVGGSLSGVRQVADRARRCVRSGCLPPRPTPPNGAGDDLPRHVP